ncbi:hypothetical protein Gotri_003414, partial [Gossypium trilobum]|nr:hypothetical protein [Gossypium trilobum]
RTKKGQGNTYCVICCNGNGSDKVPLWVIAVKIYYQRRFYSSILKGYEKG